MGKGHYAYHLGHERATGLVLAARFGACFPGDTISACCLAKCIILHNARVAKPCGEWVHNVAQYKKGTYACGSRSPFFVMYSHNEFVISVYQLDPLLGSTARVAK